MRGGVWTAAFALASGEAVYGLGEKFGPLDKRGQLIHSQVEDARSVNTGLAAKNTPFAWSPGTGAGAWGVFVHTPAMVTHGVGHPDWSHRSYALVVDDEALDLFLFAGDAPAALLDAFTALTGRAAPVPRWSLGLAVSRTCFATPEDAVALAQRLRERRIPCDALVLDHASAWRDGTRFDFTWDDERFADPRGTLEAIRAQALRVCVAEHPYVAVESRALRPARAARLAAEGERRPALRHRAGRRRRARAPFHRAGSSTSPIRTRMRGGATRTRTLFADGVDALRADGGEHVPDDAVAAQRRLGPPAAQRLPAALPPLPARGRRASSRATPTRRRWCGARAGWTGSQRYRRGQCAAGAERLGRTRGDAARRRCRGA